jgi:hypothetical protein
MLSSPSNEADHNSDRNPYDEDDDHDLFPSSDRPSTPKNNPLNATAPSKLSPPQSQSTSQRIEPGANDTIVMGGMGDDGAADYNNVTGTDGPGQMDGRRNGKQYVPGLGWKTKKANEEYQRTAETLVDQDFSLREFGDLFDDRAVVQQQEQPHQQQTDTAQEQRQ